MEFQETCGKLNSNDKIEKKCEQDLKLNDQSNDLNCMLKTFASRFNLSTENGQPSAGASLF